MVKNIVNEFKVALVQSKSIYMDSDANIKKGIKFIREAKELGADVVLFPECWITGYDFPNEEGYAKWLDCALNEESPQIQEFCSAARDNDIAVIITSFTKGRECPRNSAFVIDNSGEILMRYDKVHTCDFSDESLLESGDEFKVCELFGIKIGIMICYDREYPESARVLMLKGAEIILVPNDCGTMKPRLQALSTRAYENMVGVAIANPPGKNAGCSAAFSPIIWDKDGNAVENMIVTADEMTEGLTIAAFDMESIRAYRSSEMMGNTFRKVKAYGELLSEEISSPFLRK